MAQTDAKGRTGRTAQRQPSFRAAIANFMLIAQCLPFYRGYRRAPLLAPRTAKKLVAAIRKGTRMPCR